jgi:formylglycine-generating enzyme required for sulfatase activity
MGSATITVRGGSYLDDVTLQRSASRAQSADMTASPRVGFRCARAAP